MKTLLKIVGGVAVILLASAALAPFFHSFLPFKFSRIFNRLVMIFTLAAAAWFLISRRRIFSSYGFLAARQPASWVAVPFAACVSVLFALAAAQVGLGAAVWSVDPDPLKWMTRISVALGAGALVGVIEEFFFRGFVFHGLRHYLKWPPADSFVVTNVFYSLVHFLGDKKPLIGPNPTFVDGLRLIAAPLEVFAHPGAIWPGAVGLFLFGSVLTWLVVRTRSLYPAVGLHAGAVFFIKIDGGLLCFNGPSRLLTGSAKLYDGVAGWIFLAALWGVLAVAFSGLLKKRGAEISATAP